MSITIKDVAAAAKVSTATVSHVLNGTRFVSRETKDRVLTTIKEMGYVPSVSASGLRSRKSKRIGLLVPSISSIFSVDILDAVEQVLKENGYQVVLGCSHEKLEIEKEQIDNFNFQQIDGLLMFPAPGDHSYLEHMSRQYPIVFIDRMADNCQRDMFLGNNEQATYMVISQMIEEGHRNIGVINGTEGVSALEERVQGYRRALEDHGIPFEPEFVRKGNSTKQGGYEAAEYFVQDKRVTAILSLSPTMTVGCLTFLTRCGARIPEEIALVSYGDSEWAEITNPPLTTMRHPLFDMGQMAARKLLERMEESDRQEEERNIAPYRTVRLPMELIRRKSY